MWIEDGEYQTSSDTSRGIEEEKSTMQVVPQAKVERG
jgi:hypothetical protein